MSGISFLITKTVGRKFPMELHKPPASVMWLWLKKIPPNQKTQTNKQKQKPKF